MLFRSMNFTSNVLMARMTTTQISCYLGEQPPGVKKRVVLTSGSMEQHGPHLPIDTDTVLARELAIRASERLGNTLVAPVIPIGCAEHHMSFPGTITVKEDEFINYVHSSGASLIAHGFDQILVTAFHGGNFEPTQRAVARLRADFPDVDFREALNLSEVFKVTNGVIRENFPERDCLDAHAGCVEVSMMYYLLPQFVREAQIVNGCCLKEVPPGFSNLRDVSEHGVFGLTDGYSREIGEILFKRLVDWMISSWKV